MKVRIGPYRKNRATRVEIEPHDTWNMDYTLAMIIHPMLVQLKATQQGHPNGLTEQEWDNILNEMIWAFEQKTKHIDPLDACHDKCSNFGDPVCKACLTETQERMTNAFKLFGQYYENLWD
jgi:hypothetical protein